MKALERHLQLLLDTRDWKRLGQVMAALDPHQAAEIITDIRNSPTRPALQAAADGIGCSGRRIAAGRRPGIIHHDALHADPRRSLPAGTGGGRRPAARRAARMHRATSSGAALRNGPGGAVPLSGIFETCIGGMIRTGFIALRPEFTTEEAFEQIRRYGAGTERFDWL